ncbi:glucosamine-6-phosphate deaminase [Shimia sagamensis]|uniref:Glucosamine-6-phosphate deaminase n=1 Tax=Shimia sagamensis TaxID=1566352 RepID=A0ABY1NA64_9RHOB|nr:glucosamine-6-phosphate deaminase [Shimia sagamensis]SMP04558.1 glucosamine-6-phosphate deaminase [Shimia sagamensis]
MKVLIFKTAEEAKTHAARCLLKQVKQRPKSVLGLATGGTMEDVYAKLVSMTRKFSTKWSEVTTFNLDEYWGIPEDNPASYRTYMTHHLFSQIDINPERTYVPMSQGTDPGQAAAQFEAQILASGGIDLQLLGIGENGHIGFNEPTSSLASETRLKTLTESTRNANHRFFKTMDEVPRYALTVGIGTILKSAECLIVGTGSSKAAAVRSMIEGPVSAACPASALQMHKKVTVMLDEDAAQELELGNYYHLVHPDGQESPLNNG